MITLPEEGSLTNLSAGCFSYTKLIEIKIPSSVEYISKHYNDYLGAPFTSCKSLQKIDIPRDSKLKFIGHAIAQNTILTEFFIPENAVLEGGALNSIPRLSRYILHENSKIYNIYKEILYSYDYKILVECPCKFDSIIEFHPDCTTIAHQAFRFVKTPFDIVIPSTINTIRT